MIYISMLLGKIHRAVVTQACLAYQGSITVDYGLMLAAGFYPNQLVHINNFNNAAHWETYLIPGDPGVICLNGAPARLFMPGDEVVIMGFGQVAIEQAVTHQPKIVLVDSKNHIIKGE
jgi:aspartate 1-decarboxylase